MEDWILAWVWLPAMLCVAQFVGYCLLLIFVPRRQAPSDSEAPHITILLPAHNEARHIEEKLADLRESDYPAERCQIVVVDDGSDDDTAERVSALGADPSRHIKLVQLDSRRGKVAAILAGLAAAETDIVISTDATSRMHPNSISNMVRWFADPEVGGVTCRVEVLNRDKSTASRNQSFILQMQNSIKAAESALDSAAGFSGPLYGYRRSALGDISPDTVLEDRVFAVQLRRNGFRLRYADDAVLLYHSAESQGDYHRQKSRIMAGAFESLKLFWPMLFNPRYGFYGLLILPEYILFRALRPFLMILSAAGLAALAWLSGPFVALWHTLAWGAVLVAAFAISCLLLAPRVADRRRFLGDALRALPGIPILLSSAVTGALKFAFGRHSSVWHRVTRSAREDR